MVPVNSTPGLVNFLNSTNAHVFGIVSFDVRKPLRPRRPLQRIMATAAEASEVTIRRRPPGGVNKQPCGPVDFKVELNEENTPRNILEEIIWYKDAEVREMRERTPLATLHGQLKLAGPPRDFIGAIEATFKRTGKPGLIAEVKKASPSKGVIQPDFDPVKIAKSYEAGGASCLSVLTDKKFFQGGFENLALIRSSGVNCPLLCKEFVVEAYQLFKARASGADAVLLIAAVLPNADLEYLIKCARTIGLQCLIEVHTLAELDRVLQLKLEGCMLGINNRNLKDFQIDLNLTKTIMDSAPGQQVKSKALLMACESGIFTPKDVQFAKDTGCRAILVGESIVKQGDHKVAVENLLA